MSTSQPPVTNPASPARFFLFGGIILVAIVSVMLAILLPRQQTTDTRSQAWSTAVCAGKTTVAASACNGMCGVNEDCMSGMICYKTSGQTEGVCRNGTNPTSTTCVGTTAPPQTPPPTIRPSSTPTACTQVCDATVANSCSSGKVCVPNAGSYRTSVIISSTSSRALTSTEIGQFPSGVSIIANRQPYATSRNTTTGSMVYTVATKVSRTFNVKLFDIRGIPPALDPQVLLKTQAFTIPANTAMVIKIDVPKCGRYQVDFELPSNDPGNIPLTTDGGYFWGDNQLVFPCPGCCQ